MELIPDGTRKTIAARKIFLLVYRKDTDAAVIFTHAEAPQQRHVLFMNDPEVLKKFNKGMYASETFYAIEVSISDGEQLMAKAKKDGLNPLYAFLDREKNEMICGEIGVVRMHHAELV